MGLLIFVINSETTQVMDRSCVSKHDTIAEATNPPAEGEIQDIWMNKY